jgi:hypothetical protein
VLFPILVRKIAYADGTVQELFSFLSATCDAFFARTLIYLGEEKIVLRYLHKTLPK